MTRLPAPRSPRGSPVSLIALVGTLLLPFSATAALVSLATEPLITTTTSNVKPNVLMVLDNSGSMDWTHMPDEQGDGGSASVFSFGDYGLYSSQCNQVYYDPAITYAPPVNPDGTNYNDSSFTAARVNGFSGNTNGYGATTACDPVYDSSNCTNLDNGLAYYYQYSGLQTSAAQRDYNDTTNTFYQECNSSLNNSPGKDVFSKRRLATTMKTTIRVVGSSSTQVSSITVNGTELMSGTSTASSLNTTVASNVANKISLNGFAATASSGTITITGPASAANYTPVVTCTAAPCPMTFTADVFPDTTPSKLTNFANWYSYYRTRLLMMKTAAGRAFSSLSSSYRVGLMKISSSTPVVNLGTFEGTQRDTWYQSLYAISTSGSTPLRTALSNAGKYYAGKIGTDPVQYSCQQNFTILSTDGYWNTGDGYKLDGSLMDNEDGDQPRPYYDGAQTGTTVTTSYKRYQYTSSTRRCSTGTMKLTTLQQNQTCSVTVAGGVTGPETCTSWSNGTSDTSTCQAQTLPDPNPSNREVVSSTTTTGTVAGSSNSLADVAMYYYKTPLRSTALGNCGTGNVLCPEQPNVPTTTMDPNPYQHMTTFTLGLGASGWMQYSSSYLTDGQGTDYYAAAHGSTASASVCTWQSAGSVCNWPLPGMSGSNGLIANVDDLWHAAVNGHGVYFSATNPTTLSTSLSNALAGVQMRRGAAAAAATSTLNPVAGNNYAYVASYTTVKWTGNLEARGINTESGLVDENATWCAEDVVAGQCDSPNYLSSDSSGDTVAWYCVHPNMAVCNAPNIADGTDCKVPVATACSGTMKTRVSDTADTRVIKTASSDGTTLIDFDAAYAAANPNYFDAAHIGTLTQWTTLTATQQTAAAGANLLKFLRGQNGYEDRSGNAVDNRLYRQREAVLGDALESQPAFMGKPMFSYPYPGYADFVTAQAGRAGTVYMGANDGMMHAFNAATGAERWGYVPSMIIPNLWKLADKNYGVQHINLVNGSPITSDICTANCGTASATWRTILVAGLNGGGRGYYALDITDPDAPSLLWEFTTTAGIGKIQDDDLGYSFGAPIVTRKADGTWVVVVTSGYNNVSPGTGKGFLYVLDAATGTILSKIATAAGSTTTPSGLAKVAAWNSERGGNTAGYIYGGDLLGNLWRFDINSAVTAATGTGSAFLLAVLKDPSGNTQPVTTTPALGLVSTKHVVYVGTGKYLESSDLSNTGVQSLYAIKDDNAATTLTNPRSSLVAQTLTNTGNSRTGSSNSVDFFTGRGWYVDFPTSKERVNIDPKLVQGTLLVATIVPDSTDCEPGGYGWLNYLDYASGQPVVSNTTSVRQSSPIVGINVLYIQGKPIVEVVTSDQPTPQTIPDVSFKAGSTGYTGKRVMWRELIP